MRLDRRIRPAGRECPAFDLPNETGCCSYAVIDFVGTGAPVTRPLAS